MNGYDAIVTRRSPASFAAGDLDPSVIAKLLAAAMNAPDHGRVRPWRFIVMQGDDRARFGEILARALQKRVPNVNADVLARERVKPMRAPLIITVIARVSDNPKIPAVEQLLAVGAAAQNIMLAAHALGLGAAWKSGDPAYDPNVLHALGLTDADQIVGFMYVGMPDAFPPTPGEENVGDFVLSW